MTIHHVNALHGHVKYMDSGAGDLRRPGAFNMGEGSRNT